MKHLILLLLSMTFSATTFAFSSEDLFPGVDSINEDHNVEWGVLNPGEKNKAFDLRRVVSIGPTDESHPDSHKCKFQRMFNGGEGTEAPTVIRKATPTGAG